MYNLRSRTIIKQQEEGDTSENKKRQRSDSQSSGIKIPRNKTSDTYDPKSYEKTLSDSSSSEEDDIDDFIDDDEEDEEDEEESGWRAVLNKAAKYIVKKHPRKKFDPEEQEEMEKKLQELEDRVDLKIPTLDQILKSSLLEEEKEWAFRLYEIIQNTQPRSIEYFNLNLRLAEMLRNAPLNTIEEANTGIVSLRNKMDQDHPTLDKIMTALIPESDKIRALQLYDIMSQTYYNTDEWFSVKHRINQIINNQFKSIEDVHVAEQEEKQLKQQSFNFLADLKCQILKLKADPAIKGRIYEIYNDMINRDPEDSRFNQLKDKILWALRLPHQHRIECVHNIKDIYESLDKKIYGMQEVKEKVIQTVNDRFNNPRSRTILALKGSPGVGKTKLAKTIADAVGLPFDKISLGGAIDPTIFKGSDSTWIGSTPSLLLQILARLKCNNPVILLDEIDKLGTSEKGLAVQHALLHILDPSQNTEVQDNFLNEFSHDLSHVWFICAMNTDDLDPALKDRLNIIEVPSYTKEDMIQIIIAHTLPEALIDKGLTTDSMTITRGGAAALLKIMSSELNSGGMRPVERAVFDVVSKINLLHTNTIKLSYSLPLPIEYPYQITEKTINALMKPKIISESSFMYI